ncbi:hypothetical protein [Streptomyces sp. NPDC056785]|uniref:hypothetical protein n=1 Tax=Streptomyces sp. NPDC056785 TaxID=3345944 RepID=UPI0036BCC5D7
MNLSRGDCLTASSLDFGSISTAPCSDSRAGQFWTNDNGKLQNQNGNWLYYGDRTEDDFGVVVYSGDSLVVGTDKRTWTASVL